MRHQVRDAGCLRSMLVGIYGRADGLPPLSKANGVLSVAKDSGMTIRMIST